MEQNTVLYDKLGFNDLKVGQRLKVTVKVGDDGGFVAIEISMKTPEDEASIESMIQSIDHQQNTLRLLNREFAIPDGIEIKGLQRNIISAKDLKIGDKVKLKGKYSALKGFVPEKIRMKENIGLDLDKLQGDIDKIDREKKILEVVGFTVRVNERGTIFSEIDNLLEDSDAGNEELKYGRKKLKGQLRPRQKFFFSPMSYSEPINNVDVQLRKFPFPYRAALSLANDIDLSSWESYTEIFRFLCSNDNTSIGKGVNLPLSSSFFLFPHPNGNAFSYFQSVGCNPGRYTEQMDYLIKAGYLDTIHGFGEFSIRNPFKREYISKAYNILKQKGLRIKIWSSHGGKENTQQLDSTGKIFHAQGGNLNSTSYHLDLSSDFGIRFIWEWHDGGMTNIIGQEQTNLNEFGNRIYLGRAEVNEKIYEHFESNSDTLDFINKSNSLLIPVEFADNTRLYNFCRFNGGLFRPTASNFHFQISATNINELIQTGGYMVLYQHLGARKGPKGQSIINTPPYFDNKSIEAIQYVSDLYKDGILWVAFLIDLLVYNYTWNHLRWHSLKEGAKIKIYIDEMEDEFLNVKMKPTLEELSGITFYTPDPKNTEIYVNNEMAQNLVLNPSDYASFESISFSQRRRLPYAI